MHYENATLFNLKALFFFKHLNVLMYLILLKREDPLVVKGAVRISCSIGVSAASHIITLTRTVDVEQSLAC